MSQQENRKPKWIRYWPLHSLTLLLASGITVWLLTESDQSQASLESTSITLKQPIAKTMDKLDSSADTSNILRDSASRFELSLPEDKAPIIREAPALHSEANTTDQIHWQTATVKAGDSLAGIAHRHQIQAAQIHHLMKTGGDVEELTHIRPGDEIRYKTNDKGELLALEYDLSETQRLAVEQKEALNFHVTIVERPYEIRQNRSSAVIQNTLYGTAKEAGLSDNVIMELANIYGYDIDFALDIRQGDRFTVIWDEYFRDGEKIKDGNIIATEFINNNRSIRAVRYTDSEGDTDYYTPQGKSLKKAFLRSPVHFTRISSKFNPNRLHPIFKTKRPHRGVDYAAKTGTPIYAAGDGKVIFRGKKGGYGNTVIIQHGQRYTTLYAHMSKFNRKVRNGSRVKQGQTIGYVGATGWATGPHLHYEFRLNGVHRNPLTVKLPSAQPLAHKHMDDFSKTIEPLLSQLDTLGRTQLLALNQY